MEEEDKHGIGSSEVPSRPSPYEVLINMPTYDRDRDLTLKTDRWYTMKIPADAVNGSEGLISEVWRHSTDLLLNSSLALLGSDLYCLGCQSDDLGAPVPPVFNKVVKPSPAFLTTRQSMNYPRTFPHTVVLGGKLYVFSGCQFLPPYDPPATRKSGEVYDPMTGSWKPLNYPERHSGYTIISAALENSNRILVASLSHSLHDDDDDDDKEVPVLDRTFANFFTYDVQNFSWKMLDPFNREIHSEFPFGNKGKAVVVRNCLYWITMHLHLLAYNYESNLWLTGNLRCLNGSFLEYHDEPPLPGFFHLENERFCIMQCVFDGDPSNCYVQCVLFDVFPLMHEKKSLRISFVSTIKYNTAEPTIITESFLMTHGGPNADEEEKKNNKKNVVNVVKPMKDFARRGK